MTHAARDATDATDASAAAAAGTTPEPTAKPASPATGPVTPRRRNRRGSGDLLRSEIVAATKELLSGSGDAAAVSIRAVAEAVGVTSPSIYLHFADKDTLIEAVVVDVFAELDAAMIAAASGVDEPLARLRAYGLAYVEFAIAHPEHYRLATMQRPTEEEITCGFDEVLAASAFSHLQETVVACMAAGVFAEADVTAVTLEMWSAAHGVASLMVAKPYLPWGDKLAFADRVLCAIAVGRGLNDLLGDDLSAQEATAWFTGQRDARFAGHRDAR